MLKVVLLLTQLASLGAFCGSVLIQETQYAQMWRALSQESFVAVGQWGNSLVMLLVLVAAGVGRIWAGTETGSTVGKEERDLDSGFSSMSSQTALRSADYTSGVRRAHSSGAVRMNNFLFCSEC